MVLGRSVACERGGCIEDAVGHASGEQGAIQVRRASYRALALAAMFMLRSRECVRGVSRSVLTVARSVRQGLEYVLYPRPIAPSPLTRGPAADDPNQTEISQISGGSFYIVRPDSVKGSRECMSVRPANVASALTLLFSFNNAMAAIRRVLTNEHQFQLVITRVFEEGEEQLLEEEEECKLLSSNHPPPCLTSLPNSRPRARLPH